MLYFYHLKQVLNLNILIIFFPSPKSFQIPSYAAKSKSFLKQQTKPNSTIPPKLIIGVRGKLIQENPPKYESNLNEITK